jgi:hypothetical protein
MHNVKMSPKIKVFFFAIFLYHKFLGYSLSKREREREREREERIL